MISINLLSIHLEGDGPHGLSVNAPPGNHPKVTLKIPLDGMWHTLGIFGTPEQLLAFAAEIAGVVADHLDRPPVTVDDVAEVLRAGGREWTRTDAEGGEER